nr:hypothetical protein [Tanacetum cinerariifolium]
MSIIRKHWNEDHEGCHMFKTVKKLRSKNKDLKKLTWKDGNIFDNVKRLRDHLKEVQANIDKDPDNKLLREEESKVLAEYVEATKHEEKLHFQRAKGFLGKAIQVKDLDTIDSLFKTELSHEDALFMIRKISDEEIKNVVFSIDSNKAPSPDGFSSLFLKKAWNIIGKDV